MSRLIRIPTRFFIDHEERALPTPEIVRETKAHFFIAADDPHLPELLNDAEYYAHADGPDQCPLGIISGAKALVRAIKGGQ